MAEVKDDGGPAFQVWWIPQLPMRPFEFPVPSMDAGFMLCEALAKYDLFQFENRVKPDYCNAGGVQWKHCELTKGQWWDIEDDEYEKSEVNAMLKARKE